MSTTAGGSLNACLPTSGSHSPKIIAVAVLSATSKHFFFSPLNRSWLESTRVRRRLLSKFSYSLFFTFSTMNVVKLNMNYAK